MTLDEAIVYEKKLAEENYMQGMLCHANPNDDELDGCIENGRYHEQVAEWLEELKFIKQWKSDVMDNFCKYDCNSIEEVYKSGYEKALFDIKAKMKEINNATKPIEGVIENGWGTRFVDLAYINKISEQLKEGEQNE